MNTCTQWKKTCPAKLALSLLFLGSAALLGIAAPSWADDAVPPPWHGADIGAPALKGGAGVSAPRDGWSGPSDGPDARTQITLTSGGVDIWDSSDQFHFDYYRLAASGQIVARVLPEASLSGSISNWAKAGLMMRNSLSAGSAFAAVVVTPGNGIGMEWRTSDNASCGWTAGSGGAAPAWVKLIRSGTTVTAYCAPDNGGAPGTWSVALGSWTCASGTVYVGLCLTSGSSNAVGSAAFDSIQVSGEQAVSADAFVDSLGVNHSEHAEYNSALIALGLRHVRDGWKQNNDTLAASGVKLTAITGPPNGLTDNAGKPTSPPYNATLSDINATVNFIKNKNAASSGPGTTIEAVEGPNEPDLFWPTWYNCTYNGNGSPNGPRQYQQDLYTALKADPATAGLPVLGLAWGGTPDYNSPILSAGSLTASVDWGNFHAYPGGDAYTYGQSYGTIYSGSQANPPVYSGQRGYTVDGNDPANRLNYASHVFFPAYAPRPMAETEAGYVTGTSTGAVSQNVLAKYVPRLFLEHFNFGIRRTFWYCFDDSSTDLSNSEGNRGLVYNDATPKPAYTALKSLISLLSEGTFSTSTRMWSVPSFTPGNLAFSLAVSPVNNYTEPNSGLTVNYTKTSLVHHLLMQKSSQVFYLALWHEVADGAATDVNGVRLSGPTREIVPPALPTVVTLPATIKQATLYSYNASWTLQAAPLTISAAHQVSLNVPDSVVILSLQ